MLHISRYRKLLAMRVYAKCYRIRVPPQDGQEAETGQHRQQCLTCRRPARTHLRYIMCIYHDARVRVYVCATKIPTEAPRVQNKISTSSLSSISHIFVLRRWARLLRGFGFIRALNLSATCQNTHCNYVVNSPSGSPKMFHPCSSSLPRSATLHHPPPVPPGICQEPKHCICFLKGSSDISAYSPLMQVRHDLIFSPATSRHHFFLSRTVRPLDSVCCESVSSFPIASARNVTFISPGECSAPSAICVTCTLKYSKESFR